MLTWVKKLLAPTPACSCGEEQWSSPCWVNHVDGAGWFRHCMVCNGTEYLGTRRPATSKEETYVTNC